MLQFIDQHIEVKFETPPVHSKSPPCPAAFFWENKWLLIVKEVSAWTDFERRGKMKRNMQPAHAARASMQGSWGVGRYYFRVQTEDNRVFDIYYDRTPRDADDKLGCWILLGERKA